MTMDVSVKRLVRLVDGVWAEVTISARGFDPDAPESEIRAKVEGGAKKGYRAVIDALEEKVADVKERYGEELRATRGLSSPHDVGA